MRIKSLTNFFPLSIASYGIIFVVFALLLFGIFGWQALHQLSRLEQQLNEKNTTHARQEVNNTILEITNKTKQLARTFANWDETIQQFGNSTYYSYWKKNRVVASGFVPPYFISIELYDKAGNILSTEHDADLPEKITSFEPHALVKNHSGNTYFYYFNPVTDDRNPDTIRGYLAIKIDLIKAITILQRFKHTDIETLKLTADENVAIQLYELNKYLEIKSLPNREFNELQSLIMNTFQTFAIIATGLAILYLYLQYLLLGAPSRKLSSYIDALRQGKIQSLLNNSDNPLPVAEFEKARMSLINYQQKLDSRDAALQKNEIRMRAVLDNIVDGIIITDEHGRINSWNPAAKRIFGLKDNVASNMDIINLIAESSHKDYYAYCGRIFQSTILTDMKIEPCELLARHQDGSTFSIEIIISRMQVENKLSFVMVIRDITERKQSEERLLYMANFDDLTGLPNRALFQDRLQQAMERAKRLDKLAAVLFVDLDLFKKINDTLGHHVGDQLLIRASERIKHCLRAMDTIARLGGDEYMVILEDINHVDEITGVVTKILEIFDKPFVIQGNEIYITASAGIAIFPFDETDMDGLVKNADTAMFKAKEVGGNSYKYFTADMNTQIVEKLKMENALRHALQKNEFRLYYQPRIDLNTGKMTGMEALLRWVHPTMGIVSPVDFIPLLEETGLIVPVGEWVLQEACRQTRTWNEKYKQNFRVSVNLSVRQFLQKDLTARFQKIINTCEIEPDCIELEITEGLLVDNFDFTVKILEEFHEMGIHISVDDFGTGYSSLSYLKKLPINTLKIDRSFVRDITVDMDDAAIISAIIALAQNLRLNVTAEGIETEDQLSFLQNLHCDEAQGFYFSRPLPEEDFEQFINGRDQNLASA